MFKDLRWVVVGDIALANYGSSMPPSSIDFLVSLYDKKQMEAEFAKKGIGKVGGGERYGFKYTSWDGFLNTFYYQNTMPEADGECIAAKNWPLCQHAAAIAWTLLDFSKQNIANVVDVIVGGLQINWRDARIWSENFGSNADYDSLQLIDESVVQDESVWKDLI